MTGAPSKGSVPTAPETGAGRRTHEPASGEPIVDVGIPTTGSAPHLLAQAVESVFAQTVASWRLMISEVGPGLETVRKALEPYLGDPRVRHVVTRESIGRGQNWTNLIRTGNAPYHGLLHDDDLWGPQFLERRIQFLDEHPEVGFVYGGTVVISEDGTPRGRTRLELPPGVQPSAQILTALYRRNFIGVPTYLVRRTAYEAIGLEYRELLFTDNEMFLRLAGSFDVGCLAVWDGYYRIHSHQTSTDRSRWAEHHLALLDEVEDLPLPRSLRKMVRAETHLRCALDAVQRTERRQALAHVGEALRTDPLSCVTRPALLFRLAAALGALATGSAGRRALTRRRERRWQMGGAAGLLAIEDRDEGPESAGTRAVSLTAN